MEQEVVFNASATQQKFIDAVFSRKFRHILFGGSAGGGKTYAVLGTLLLLCRVYPGSKWVIVRNTLTSLKLTTIPSFLKLCPTSFIAKYNQETQTVTFVNGSQIIFFGENYADDKELLRFRGLEASGFAFEEVNECQESTYFKAVERAGRLIIPNMPPPLILSTCNPARNWVKVKWYDKHVAGSLPPDWLYIPSKITDNPFVSENAEYMESLKALSTYQYETMIEGNWELENKTGGEHYHGFDIERNTGHVTYDPMRPLIITWDENVSPYLSCIVSQVKSTVGSDGKVMNEIGFLAEILGEHPRNTVEAVCKMFSEIFPVSVHKSTVELRGDATSVKQDVKLEKGSNFYLLILGYLSAYKIQNKVSRSNESVSMRANWINAVMEKQTGNIRLIVDKSCKTIISDLMMVKQNPDGTKLKQMTVNPLTKVRSQSVGHTSDCIDYTMTGVFPNEYATFKNGSRPYVAPTYGSNISRNNDWGSSNNGRHSNNSY